MPCSTCLKVHSKITRNPGFRVSDQYSLCTSSAGYPIDMITWINIRQEKSEDREQTQNFFYILVVMLPYVRESRTHFACCSITIRAQRVKSRRVFDLKFTHEPAIARAKFYAMENNANGRTAETPRTPTTERTLTFSSTWRFRVDTCKRLCYSSIKYELFLLIISE